MTLSGIGRTNLEQALSTALAPSAYHGTVGNGSDTQTVVDATGHFFVNQWAGYILQFTSNTKTEELRGVWQRIASNESEYLTLSGWLPIEPQPGDTYNIRWYAPYYPRTLTTHYGYSVNPNTGWPIRVVIRGYSHMAIFVQSDQPYDLYYQISGEPLPYGVRTALASAQAATGSYVRGHPVISGGLWLVGHNLIVEPYNVGAVAATMTVTVYMTP